MTRSRNAGELLLAALAALLVITVASAARAQSDDAVAQALFEDGRKLMEEGQYEKACPKLVESQRLAPAGGTQLNVAHCHEKQGKLATAWSEYKTALAMARHDDKPERVAFAKEHIDAIAPRLNKLTIEIAADAVEGLVITHNGTPLRKAVIGTALPVDGGSHRIEASAPGRESWSTTLELGVEGEIKTVLIPALVEVTADAAAPDPAPAPAPAPSGVGDTTQSDGSTQRTIGYVVGAAGIASVIIGAVFGAQALSKRSESDDLCGDGDECPNTADGKAGLEANEDAQTNATLSNAFIGAGLGLAAAGVVLVLTAPSHDAESAALLAPFAGPDGGGAVLRLAW